MMFRSIFAVMILGLLLLTGGCDKIRQATSPDADDENNSNFQKAKEKYGMMDYAAAIDYFERALRQNPELAKAHLEMGLIYEDKLKDHISAIYHFRQYMKLRPDSGKKEMVEEFMQNSMQQLMAQDSVMLSSEKAEIIRLKTENHSLLIQLANLRKQLQAKGSAKESSPPTLRPEPAPKSSTPSAIVSPASPRPPETNVPTITAKEQIDILSQPDKPVPAAPVTSTHDIPPVSKTPPPAVPSVSAVSYTVQPGDTLASISRKFYNTSNQWQKILEANPSLGEPKNLKPGQVLVIPK